MVQYFIDTSREKKKKNKEVRYKRQNLKFIGLFSSYYVEKRIKRVPPAAILLWHDTQFSTLALSLKILTMSSKQQCHG